MIFFCPERLHDFLSQEVACFFVSRGCMIFIPQEIAFFVQRGRMIFFCPERFGNFFLFREAG